MNNAMGYMGFTLMDTYDVTACSQKCNAIDGCAAFNVGKSNLRALHRVPTD